MTVSRYFTQDASILLSMLLSSAPYNQLNDDEKMGYREVLSKLFYAFINEALQQYQHTTETNRLPRITGAVFQGVAEFLVRITAEVALHAGYQTDEQHSAHVQLVLDNIRKTFDQAYFQTLEELKAAMVAEQQTHQAPASIN